MLPLDDLTRKVESRYSRHSECRFEKLIMDGIFRDTSQFISWVASIVISSLIFWLAIVAQINLPNFDLEINKI
jgi:hypothetical protein